MTWDAAHALRVAGRFEYGTDEWLVGLLHDVLEDTDCSPEDLFDAMPGPIRVAAAVVALTRGAGLAYGDYIRRLQSYPLAARVKVADLEDNLDRMDEAHESLRPRYEKALAALAATSDSGRAARDSGASPDAAEKEELGHA